MNTIVCRMAQCNYCSKSGFCQKEFVFMTEQGFCERIYDRRGFVKENWNAPVEKKQEEEENVD